MATCSKEPLAVLPLLPIGCTLNHYKNPSQIALKKRTEKKYAHILQRYPVSHIL